MSTEDTEPAAQAFLVTDAALREHRFALSFEDGSLLILDERMPRDFIGRGMADGSVVVRKVQQK